MRSFPTTESTFLFPGPIGNIELHTTSNNHRPATAIICHPHPLHGGTMTNKVVTTLAKTFDTLGLRTVRFNFRGVGKTDGQYDEGRGETTDLLTITEWIKTQFPHDEIWLAGFSFGAFVATKAATQTTAARLITIAPPVSRFNLADLPQVTCPWWIVQGEQDEVVPPDEVFAWIETLNPKPTVIRMPGAGHFFHGQLLDLREALEKALREFD